MTVTQKILLVDDQPSVLKMLGLALHHEGYQVVGAHDGFEALNKVAGDRPDLVILDVMMPGMNGFEVCQRIRQSPESAQLPILMVTATAREDDKVAGFAAGADDYMVKPVSIRELSARVKVLLARRSLTMAIVAPQPEARILAFTGVKGGVGTTTLAVNTAIAATQAGVETILADMHPHGGGVAAQLGHRPRRMLNTLLEQSAEAIEPSLLQSCLLSHPNGMRVLPASLGPPEKPNELTAEHVEMILNHLAGQTDLVILDLEGALNPGTLAALRRSTRITLVSEADHTALHLTQGWLETLDKAGIGGTRLASLSSTGVGQRQA